LNFIIDKNVLKAALTGNNPNTGEFDPTSLTLLIQIPTICHFFIVTKEIENEFIRIFEEFRRKPEGKPTLDAVTMYFNAKKMGKINDTRSSDTLPQSVDENGIKDEDLPFARLSRLTHATLITYDQPLRAIMGENARPPNEVLELILNQERN